MSQCPGCDQPPAQCWRSEDCPGGRHYERQLARTQSTNARPCNCDQALKAERALVSSRAKDDLFNAFATSRIAAVVVLKDEWMARALEEKNRRVAAETKLSLMNGIGNVCEERGQKLAAVERILCDLVSAPSLSVAQFADPTLERIRLAMLGRAG